MLYPVYVHHDKGSAYGATVPDFEGCFAAADDFRDLAAAVQEAAEVYFEDEDMEVPEPSDPESFEGEAFTDGSWSFIDIDTDRLNTKKERVNISVPTYALREIDEHVEAIGDNRSHFLYSTALKVIRGEIPEVVLEKVPVKAKPRTRVKARPTKKAAAKKRAVYEQN